MIEFRLSGLAGLMVLGMSLAQAQNPPPTSPSNNPPADAPAATTPAAPAPAQAPESNQAPAQGSSSAAPTPAQAPSPAQPAPVPPAPSPDLSVASVKMEDAWRASKLIGLPVYNDQKAKIGSVDDLMVKDNNRIVMAVISVGGFLGIGNKLVGVPWEELHLDTSENSAKLLMPGANKDSLSALPTFVYAGNG